MSIPVQAFKIFTSFISYFNFFFFFGHVMRLAGSQFPNQELNSGRGSESLDS